MHSRLPGNIIVTGENHLRASALSQQSNRGFSAMAYAGNLSAENPPLLPRPPLRNSRMQVTLHIRTQARVGKSLLQSLYRQFTGNLQHPRQRSVLIGQQRQLDFLAGRPFFMAADGGGGMVGVRAGARGVGGGGGRHPGIGGGGGAGGGFAGVG